jgi:two-component sensor histidine kinase
MTDNNLGHGGDVFAHAFASLRQAASIVEPVGTDRTSGRDWRYTAINPAMQRLFKVDDLTGQTIRDVRPKFAPEWYADFERVIETGASETLIRQAGRDAITLQVNLSPLVVGGRDAVLVQMWDVTSEHVIDTRATVADSQKKHHENDWQNRLASQSLDRIRNLMSIVRLMARLSAPSHPAVEDYLDHFVGRLQAMGRTQIMLARLPGSRMNLADLVDEELLVNAASQGRCLAAGPDIALCPHAAEIVTLAIHELATNSIKYGALGDKGDIQIKWTTCLRDQVSWLIFSWQETSPRTAFIPLRKGFGTCLIEERIAYELRGEGRLHVKNNGVLAEFAFPLT